MVNVRRGINIRTSFAIQRNGIPEDLSQAQNLRVVIRHKCQPNSAAAFTGSAVGILGNSVSVVVTDAMQKTMASGDYIIEAAYRLINPAAPDGYDPYIIDSDVFTLTDRSSDVGGVSCGDVTVQVVNLTGEVSFCSQALEQLIDEAIAAVQSANEAAQAANDAADAAMAIVDSKVDIDGLNANVKRLQFDTTNPTAPMQIGQIAWDNDEHTLVTHDGLHSHPLGKELELRARNTSGVTILNGRACYVTGSTGDNLTIALATNTDGDVAQKTIGVATIDIANNAFGIVTTFGEVNDIDTSALTLGAIVYLGANGQLTTTEPVAPTPKIVIGICVRQHAQVGKLFVSTRPIARLSKLSEVHAPTLTDNDVLRYNGATLRWEVYSLAGKADLVAGKVPTSQLPSYVDDVLEYANLAAFPATGETGKIYVAINTNLTYRWSGTAYVEISKSLAIGETADTAYRGDRGKTAYDHSQTTGNPHSTTAAQIPNTPAGTVAATTVQGAINELASDIVQVETDLNLFNADFINAINGIANNIGYDLGLGKKTDDTYRLLNIIGKRTGYVGYLGNYTLHGFEYTPGQNADIVTLIGNTNYNTNKPIQSQMRPFEELISTKERFYLRDDVTKRIDGSASNLADPNYLQKVYIPEFWYGAMFDSVRNKIQLWFSLIPVTGFMHIAPQAVCRYPGYIDGAGKARSHSGFKYPNNKNLIEFTAACQLTSEDLFVLPYYTYNALSLLLLHDIGRRNAQAVWTGLQTGSTYSNITSGKTDILVTPSGEVLADAETASNKPFRWRFIENLYGDCWKILSGVYLNQVGAERRVMICPDTYKANTSSVISADYIQACIIAAGEGWLKDINAPWINAKAYGASSTTGYSDYTYNNTTDKNILLAGGASYSGAYAGPFSLISTSSASSRNITIGALFASIDRLPAATQIVKPALIY